MLVVVFSVEQPWLVHPFRVSRHVLLEHGCHLLVGSRFASFMNCDVIVSLTSVWKQGRGSTDLTCLYKM